MPTYLMTWNPTQWIWDGLEEFAEGIPADQHITSFGVSVPNLQFLLVTAFSARWR